MLQFLHSFAAMFQERAWSLFLASTLLLALEVAIAHDRYSLASRLRAGMFWVVYLAITVVALTFFQVLWGTLGVKPLLHVDFRWLTGAPAIAVKVLGWISVALFSMLAGEFFYYWFHRLQHTIPFLWRFHEVHHSLREMSAWNSNHHFTEEIFRIPFVAIPFSLLLQIDSGYMPAVVGLLFVLQGQYVHSNTKVHLGPLRYLIADNRYHRLHHSIEARHHNRNFGSGTPLWDMVFRTATFPKKGEWPATGVDGVSEPTTLRDFLFMPFRRI